MATTTQLSVRRSTLSIEETARTLGVSTATIRRALKDGRIPHMRLGDRYLISVEVLSELLGAPVRIEEPVEDDAR